jgi:hypothetical protein
MTDAHGETPRVQGIYPPRSAPRPPIQPCPGERAGEACLILPSRRLQLGAQQQTGHGTLAERGLEHRS